MPFRRTMSAAFLSGWAVIFFLVVPAAGWAGVALAQLPQPDATGQATPSREQGPAMRIPRQQASRTAAVDGVVRSEAAAATGRPVPGAQLILRNLQTGQRYSSTPNAEGLFRI